MIKLVDGGHFSKKGYYYKLYMVVPSFKNNRCKSITGSDQVSKEISFPTKFCLTRNNLYANISLSLLGLGLGLEIHSKS